MGKRSRAVEHEPHSSSKKSKSKPQDERPSSSQHTQGTPQESSHEQAVSQLPPSSNPLGHVPAYTSFTISPSLPPLPPILDPTLLHAPFIHKSVAGNYNRTATHHDTTYERLEFLGDAQLEHIASRLIYERFSHLPAGAQSQLRELLVKNETLAEFARAYGFDRKVQVGDLQRVQDVTRERGNKGFNKILGDVFEAYIAAVILSHGDEGFGVAEKWMTGLWAPKIVEAARRDRFFHPNLELETRQDVDLVDVYDPAAKADLQRKILGGPGTKLHYEPWKPAEELKGDRLGQNRHYIALYLTGYGHERKLLGKGEGKNKVEAGNWAATQAMFGEAKEIVAECEKQRQADRERRKTEEGG